MKINMEEINVEIKLSSKPNLKAIAVIGFRDFTVKGFRLSVSEHKNDNLDKEELYLQPPSIRVGRGWQVIFFVEDKEVWKKIERAVFDKYQEQERIKKIELDGDEIFGKKTI